MSTTSSNQQINLSYLETMTGGDADMMHQMLDMLLDEIPAEMSKIKQSVAESDWQEVFQISHKLKTTLAFIGNEEMSAQVKTIEYCSRHEVELHEVPKLVEQLVALSHPVVKELKTVNVW